MAGELTITLPTIEGDPATLEGVARHWNTLGSGVGDAGGELGRCVASLAGAWIGAGGTQADAGLRAFMGLLRAVEVGLRDGARVLGVYANVLAEVKEELARLEGEAAEVEDEYRRAALAEADAIAQAASASAQVVAGQAGLAQQAVMEDLADRARKIEQSGEQLVEDLHRAAVRCRDGLAATREVRVSGSGGPLGVMIRGVAIGVFGPQLASRQFPDLVGGAAGGVKQAYDDYEYVDTTVSDVDVMAKYVMSKITGKALADADASEPVGTVSQAALKLAARAIKGESGPDEVEAWLQNSSGFLLGTHGNVLTDSQLVGDMHTEFWSEVSSLGGAAGRSAVTGVKALGALRVLGVASSAFESVTGAQKLLADGTPAEAIKKEGGARYAEDWASEAFNVTSTIALLCPNPVTDSIAALAGVAYGVTAVIANRKQIAHDIGQVAGWIGDHAKDAWNGAAKAGADLAKSEAKVAANVAHEGAELYQGARQAVNEVSQATVKTVSNIAKGAEKVVDEGLNVAKGVAKCLNPFNW